MFKLLTELLHSKADTVTFTVSRVDAPDVANPRLRVNVMPQYGMIASGTKENKSSLSQPLQLTGTAEELDSPEFGVTLKRFTDSVNGLINTIDQVEAAHKEAADKLKAKPVPKAPAKPAPKAPAKPAPKPAAKAPAKPAARPTPKPASKPSPQATRAAMAKRTPPKPIAPKPAASAAPEATSTASPTWNSGSRAGGIQTARPRLVLEPPQEEQRPLPPAAPEAPDEWHIPEPPDDPDFAEHAAPAAAEQTTEDTEAATKGVALI